MVSMIVTVPATLRAQESASEIPSATIRATTRLVVVDVVVTGKKGQPITGLKAGDFTVKENGKVQKVSVFVPPSAANRAAAASAPKGILSNHPDAVGPAGAPIVLLLDAANSPFKDQAYARWQMLKYVTEQGQSGNPVAVLTLTDRLRVIQQFTSDPQILSAAISNFMPREPLLRPTPLATAAGVSPGVSELSAQGALVAGAQADLTEFSNAQIAFDLQRRTLITLEAMRALVRMLGGLQGRKNVVWLTAELPFDLIPEDRAVSSEEALADLPAQGRQRSVTTNAAGSLAAEQRSLYSQSIREVEMQLASAGIAIYPVDVRGLGIDIATTGTMEEIAAETGGKEYTNQNEIKFGIALAASDQQASYSLGYYPDNKKWDGKYRTLEVRLAQSDAQIRYRKGYFAIDPTQKKNQDYERDVAAALQFNAPATQVSFMAQANPVGPGKVQVLFLVDAHTVSAEDSNGNKKLDITFYASTFDSKGKNLGTRSIKVDRAFDAATYQQIQDKGIMVPLDMDVPAGAKELRLAVLDNRTGFIGTLSGYIGQ
jgi:VWFA-related protein